MTRKIALLATFLSLLFVACAGGSWAMQPLTEEELAAVTGEKVCQNMYCKNLGQSAAPITCKDQKCAFSAASECPKTAPEYENCYWKHVFLSYKKCRPKPNSTCTTVRLNCVEYYAGENILQCMGAGAILACYYSVMQC